MERVVCDDSDFYAGEVFKSMLGVMTLFSELLTREGSLAENIIFSACAVQCKCCI